MMSSVSAEPDESLSSSPSSLSLPAERCDDLVSVWCFSRLSYFPAPMIAEVSAKPFSFTFPELAFFPDFKSCNLSLTPSAIFAFFRSEVADLNTFGFGETISSSEPESDSSHLGSCTGTGDGESPEMSDSEPLADMPETDFLLTVNNADFCFGLLATLSDSSLPEEEESESLARTLLFPEFSAKSLDGRSSSAHVRSETGVSCFESAVPFAFLLSMLTTPWQYLDGSTFTMYANNAKETRK